MATRTPLTIRAFDGSLTDAQGLLAVERAVFDESPYSARQIRTLLDDGPQRAWLACSGELIVGFVIAFVTHSLSGSCLEIDLLAVRRPWRGQGLATRLIRAAAAWGKSLAPRARAVVATDNPASANAFVRAGFRPASETCQLLIFRPRESNEHRAAGFNGQVREATVPAEAAEWLAGPPPAGPRPGLALLLAENEDRPSGYAELSDVQTLLYRGTWIESLAAAEPAARQALVGATVMRARAAGLDEVGMMVPERDPAVQQTLLATGFRSLGEFRWLTAGLPLPGLADGRHG